MAEPGSPQDTPPPPADTPEGEILGPPSPEAQKPETPPDLLDRPSGAADAVAAESGKRAEKAYDRAAILDLAEKCIDGDNEDLIALAEKSLSEKGAEGADPEAVKQSVEAIKKFLFSPEWKAVWQKFDELGAKPEFSKIDDKKKEILRAILMPVMNGHLTAEDTSNLVTGITILPKDTAHDSSKTHGYSGNLSYDARNKKIIITEKALKDKFTTTVNGAEVEFNLNFRHMVSHEMSHGLTESAGATPRKNEGLKKELLDKEPVVSSKMVSEARKIIDNADQYRDAQPQHVQNVLDSLKNIEGTYSSLPPDMKQRVGSLEDYANARKVVAADEIITDYTAIFLQSDGSFDDFVEKCVAMAPTESMARYLSGPMTADAQRGEDSTRFAVRRLREINGRIKNARPEGELEADNHADQNPENAGYLEGETLSEIQKSCPELVRLIDSYKTFYKDILDMKDRSKGKVAAPAQTEDGDDDDIIEEDVAGFGAGMGGGMGGSSGSDGRGGHGDSVGNELIGVAHHLLQELGIPVGSQAQLPTLGSGQSGGSSESIRSIPAEKLEAGGEKKKAEREAVEAQAKKKAEDDAAANNSTPAAPDSKT